MNCIHYFYFTNLTLLTFSQIYYFEFQIFCSILRPDCQSRVIVYWLGTYSCSWISPTVSLKYSNRCTILMNSLKFVIGNNHRIIFLRTEFNNCKILGLKKSMQFCIIQLLIDKFMSYFNTRCCL